MNHKKTYQILGIRPDTSLEEIKKKYRALMILTHPDSGEESNYPYDASSINLAYEYITKHGIMADRIKNHNFEEKTAPVIRWNAPVNPQAYAPRSIFHTVEEKHGISIGLATLDYGKYMWTKDEDFSLFLKSLYLCCKEILDQATEEHFLSKEKELFLLSELIYLMAQQYVDSALVLELSDKESKGIYQLDAMVEMDVLCPLAKGEYLIPSRISRHKLYVKKEGGKEIGYLSFKDDRFYYGLIPLFERRSVKVKIQVVDEKIQRMTGKKYREVNLQLLFEKENRSEVMENINDRINRLLNNL